MISEFRVLRLFLPLVALGAALLMFLSVGLVIGFMRHGGAAAAGPCDATLGPLATTADGTMAPRSVTSARELTEEQLRNAALIISVARGMGLPPRAWLVALATAMQESTLRNLNYGDRDSLGLFQQRPSQGWGAPAQVTDPVYATTTFLNRLQRVPGWDRLPITVAAQTVQRSAFPEAYAHWEGLAAQLVQLLSDVVDPTGCGLGAAELPEGVVRAAIAFVLDQVGKPYVWGATGPNSYDCSGLILRAFQVAGVFLPRVASEQYRAGGHLPLAQAAPGDLLFLATDRRDPATIHHVMLYLGDGMLAEAPYSGKPVRTRQVDWDNPELVPLITRPGTAPNPA
jgi:peptidoglycan DL-endopeptidase CwlO